MAENGIHPDTTLDHVHLTVAEIDRSVDFYQSALGFSLHRREGPTAYLGAGGADLLVLTEQRGARRLTGRAGLYHFAILVPSRLDLAMSLKRIGDTGTRVEGFADHLVSEAIYLPDPDGNGIEIYRDHPRGEWRDKEGQLRMGSEPLDVDGVLAELDAHPEPLKGLDPETVIGHIHLHVANIAAAEDFYVNTLGFDLMMRYGTSAGFVSAGGYHHHIGYNTWAGVGASPAEPDSVGLRYFVIRLPNSEELDRVASRVRRAGLTLEETPAGLLARDPSQNAALLATGDAAEVV